MPELPEVEVLVRHLGPRLQGRRVDAVIVHRDRSVRPTTPEALARVLIGATFGATVRRAKFLCFNLISREGAPVRLMGHLGMTGRMYLQPLDQPFPKHTAVTMRLGDAVFVYEDTRGFGRLTLDDSMLEEVGPEPLDDPFPLDQFQLDLKSSRQPIKVKLLDQRLIAGVGNIYASEALYRAGISPMRRCHQLRPGEVKDLLQAVRLVLRQAIDLGSRAALDFRAGEGGLFYYGALEGGKATENERFEVYDREAQPCRRCGAAIVKRVQAQRSTFYCPRCQKTAGP